MYSQNEKEENEVIVQVVGCCKIYSGLRDVSNVLHHKDYRNEGHKYRINMYEPILILASFAWSHSLGDTVIICKPQTVHQQIIISPISWTSSFAGEGELRQTFTGLFASKTPDFYHHRIAKLEMR
ncbi:hypothetical protein PR048_033103 [Dryococelus australis]|uniref:Uncharacterized protein n=1 Tax=Dryococelus australis TaxID=614101 RepID=A0ABQ9FZB1_9NEOP|nr:hypothetical protein PR048_033103 [Dryococelus australis]